MLNKLQGLGQREKFLMSLAGVFLLLLVLEYCVRVPAAYRYDVLDEAIENAERQLLVNKSYYRKKADVQKQYDAIRGLLAKATLQTEDIDEIKGEIDDLAVRTGLTYATMSHREPTPISPYCDEYLVEIAKFETEMQNVLKFVHELHRTPGMFRVAALTVKPVKGQSKVAGSITVSKVMITDASAEAPPVADSSEPVEE